MTKLTKEQQATLIYAAMNLLDRIEDHELAEYQLNYIDEIISAKQAVSSYDLDDIASMI